MKYTKIIFAFLFIAVYFSECKKYPNDSKTPHLETVKWRLAGGILKGKTWVSQGVYRVSNDTVVVGWSDQFVIDFSRNGDFDGQSTFLYFKGKWEFVDKKNKLKITDNNGVASEYTIMKLDYNALWFQNDSLLFKFEKHKR